MISHNVQLLKNGSQCWVLFHVFAYYLKIVNFREKGLIHSTTKESIHFAHVLSKGHFSLLCWFCPGIMGRKLLILWPVLARFDSQGYHDILYLSYLSSLFQMLAFQTSLLLTYFLMTSAIPLWYKHLTKPSSYQNEIPRINKLTKHSSYEDSEDEDELPGVLYSLSHATGDCKLDEDIFSICYLCGKVVESEKVLIGCCEQSGLVRDFCFELLS